MIDRQEKLELVLVRIGESKQLFLQQDIVNRAISEYQRDSGRVIVDQHSLNDLVARSDTGSSGNQPDLRLALDSLLLNREVSVAIVFQAPFRAFHQHLVADIHRLHVLRH